MTAKNAPPYDGTIIFKPVMPMKALMAKFEARRNDVSDKLHKMYAGPEVAEQRYQEALKRLNAADMISPAEAALRMGIEKQAYVALAEKGEALLIRMGSRAFVPAWSITPRGAIDTLKVDIAREFVLEGISYFKFLDYLKFMTEEKIDIVATVAPETLSALFNAAGVQDYECAISVRATMNQLCDRGFEDKKSGNRVEPFAGWLFKHLDSSLIHGGWDAHGGLSRPFLNKYKLPGQTMDEERSAPPPAP